LAISPGIKSKANKVLDNGKLEKAYIVSYEKPGSSFEMIGKIQVQFNPAEYTIQRGVNHSEKQALGRDVSSAEIQTVNAKHSVLSVSLYFDSYTELKSNQGAANAAKNKAATFLKRSYNFAAASAGVKDNLPNFDMNEDFSPNPDYTVNRRLEELLSLIKYAPEGHEPPHIGFIWGDSIFFVGKIASQTTQYTVFDRDGTPIRAKLDISIIGEDVSYDPQKYPFESPDRTKQRTLRYGDQIWMMAQEEYGDASRWKIIAKANHVMNPRLMGGMTNLKVPSIR